MRITSLNTVLAVIPALVTVQEANSTAALLASPKTCIRATIMSWEIFELAASVARDKGGFKFNSTGSWGKNPSAFDRAGTVSRLKKV